MTFQGHEAPILGVCLPQMSGYIISCDIKGAVKIWDAKSLFIIETKHIDIGNLKCMISIPKLKRIIFGGLNK